MEPILCREVDKVCAVYEGACPACLMSEDHPEFWETHSDLLTMAEIAMDSYELEGLR